MGHSLESCIVFIFCARCLKKHYFKWEKSLSIFNLHFIFFAEGPCDNFKNDVVLLIALMVIVKYFRKKNVFKNKFTSVNTVLSNGF